MVKWLGRWAPLVGSSLLALSVLLPLVGLPELGALLGNVAATPGVTRMDSSAFSSSFAARRLTVVARAVTPWGTVGVPVISLP